VRPAGLLTGGAERRTCSLPERHAPYDVRWDSSDPRRTLVHQRDARALLHHVESCRRHDRAVNSFLNANAELVITLVKIVLLLFIVLTVNAI